MHARLNDGTGRENKATYDKVSTRLLLFVGALSDRCSLGPKPLAIKNVHTFFIFEALLRRFILMLSCCTHAVRSSVSQK